MMGSGRHVSTALFLLTWALATLVTPTSAIHHSHTIARLLILKGLMKKPLTLPLPIPLPVPVHKEVHGHKSYRMPFSDYLSIGHKGKHHGHYNVKEVHKVHKHHHPLPSLSSVEPLLSSASHSVAPLFAHSPKLSAMGAHARKFFDTDDSLLPSLDDDSSFHGFGKSFSAGGHDEGSFGGFGKASSGVGHDDAHSLDEPLLASASDDAGGSSSSIFPVVKSRGSFGSISGAGLSHHASSLFGFGSYDTPSFGKLGASSFGKLGASSFGGAAHDLANDLDSAGTFHDHHVSNFGGGGSASFPFAGKASFPFAGKTSFPFAGKTTFLKSSAAA